MNISVVKSNKGKEKLIIDGYGYVLDKKQKEIYRWICEARKSAPCRGRVSTRLAENCHMIVKEPSVHTHDALAHALPVAKTNNYLKTMAATSGLRPSQIHLRSTVSCEENSRIYLPSAKAQKEKVKRIRNETKLKEPKTLSEIDIPEALKFCDGDQFVLSVKHFNNQAIILIGTI